MYYEAYEKSWDTTFYALSLCDASLTRSANIKHQKLLKAGKTEYEKMEQKMGKTYGVHSWKPEQTKLPKLNMSDLGRNLTFYFPEVLKISVIFKNFVF